MEQRPINIEHVSQKALQRTPYKQRRMGLDEGVRESLVEGWVLKETLFALESAPILGDSNPQFMVWLYAVLFILANRSRLAFQYLDQIQLTCDKFLKALV